MGVNLYITNKLQNYINEFGLELNPIQQEIIRYNIQNIIKSKMSA